MVWMAGIPLQEGNLVQAKKFMGTSWPRSGPNLPQVHQVDRLNQSIDLLSAEQRGVTE